MICKHKKVYANDNVNWLCLLCGKHGAKEPARKEISKTEILSAVGDIEHGLAGPLKDFALVRNGINRLKRISKE